MQKLTLSCAVNNLTVSQADGQRAGIPSTALKTPPEHGAEYVVNLEVFHQLGCLVSMHFHGYVSIRRGLQDHLFRTSYAKSLTTTTNITSPSMVKVSQTAKISSWHTPVSPSPRSSFIRLGWLTKVCLGHCIDLLRQRLMCTADVTLLPFTWAASTPWVPHPKVPIAMPDFDHHNHMCRDFDAVVEWAQERQKPELFKNPKVKYTVQEGERVVDYVP